MLCFTMPGESVMIAGNLVFLLRFILLRYSHAVLFRNHAFLKRHPALSRPADARQDDPAAVRRRAGCLEYVHGLLPGYVAGRLRVRSFHTNSLEHPSTDSSACAGALTASSRLAPSSR